MAIVFTIPGEPQGKARPRVVKDKRTGKTKAYTPDKTVAYEELVRARYKAVAGNDNFKEHSLEVCVTAYFGIPKSKSKKQKALMLSNVIYPVKKPDCDNIAKIICDALNGIAYKDDSQIVKLSVYKAYAEIPSVKVEIFDASEALPF
jgi:Holliday junction resolvase RusA-like endonuclease